MKRRDLIASSAILSTLSGCISSLGSQTGSLQITTQPKVERDDIGVGAEVVNKQITKQTSGKISLSLKNASTNELELASLPAKPFGVLELVWNDDKTTLWSDQYETSNLVETNGKEVTVIRQAEPILRLGPGESISQVYSIGYEERNRVPHDRSLAVQRDSSNSLLIDGTRFNMEVSVS